MTLRSPRTDSPVFKASVLSIALMLSETGAVSPVLADLARQFPDESQSTIQGFVSMPAIAALIATLVAGALANRVGKRRLVLVGILLIIIGGTSPLALIPTGSYPLVIAFRLLAGFGMGLLQPLSASLVADFYQGRERSTMLGWQSSIVGAGNIVWGLVVSALMLMGWMSAFLVYLLPLIILALVWRNVPEPQAPTDAPEPPAKDSSLTASGLPRLPVGTWGAVALMFLMTISFQALGISTPFLASERAIASGSQVSLVMTVFGIASVLAGVVFGSTFRALRQWTGTAALLILAAGLGLGVVAQNLAVLFIMAVLVGLGFGTFMPFAINAINARATADNSAAATALVFSGAALAGFCAPYYFGLVDRFLASTSAGTQFATAAVTTLATALAATVYYQIDARWAIRQSATATEAAAPGAH